MPIIDVYLLVVLAAGLMFGRGSPAAKRRNAAIVLVLMMANYGLRGSRTIRRLLTRLDCSVLCCHRRVIRGEHRNHRFVATGNPAHAA